MNDRQKIIAKLKKYFVYECAESPMSHSGEFTQFDEEILAALDKLFDAHRDVVVPPECASLGFVLKSESKPEDYRDPCCTVPCFGGKMPYQKDWVACSVLFVQDGVCSNECHESPMQRVKDLAGDKRETNDDAD